MNRLRSEILFNRAMLWLMLSHVELNVVDNKFFAGCYLIFGVLNLVKSARIWCEEG